MPPKKRLIEVALPLEAINKVESGLLKDVAIMLVIMDRVGGRSERGDLSTG